MKHPVLFPGQPYLLYADDDTDDRAFLNEMMRKVNPLIRLIGFENGLELVQFLESLTTGTQLPSCIILDLEMPVWDGMRTLRALKDSVYYNHIPVYMLSTSRNVRDRILAVNTGVAEFMAKPYVQNELQDLCEEFALHTTHAPRYKGEQRVQTS